MSQEKLYLNFTKILNLKMSSFSFLPKKTPQKSLHKNCPPHATVSMSTIPNVFPDHVLFFLYESNCQASLAGS